MTGQVRYIDPDEAQIRCLAHIIHLAVMALLAELGAVSTQGMRSLDISSNIEPMSTEEAESFGDGIEAFRSDVELMDEHNTEDFKSSITKVCCCIFVHLLSFNLPSQLHKICKIVHSSPQQTEGFYQAIQDFNASSTWSASLSKEKLIIDMPIWWNSIFLMLQQAYEYHDVCLMFSMILAHPVMLISNFKGHHRYV
jgi:hypothetical protein